ncbi:B-box zinc finger protein 20-like [Henckelia pumila]|uniref:B-box zinc finger protein 20-like n=1 Tax=Henckelia pumila TaxID=405737 RepID=UPI003C6DF67C
MKIQCDECGREAYVFCTADEAALCSNCDAQVHNANKLAAKHHRFALQRNHREFKEFPLCDVCQGKRALLFCKEDRALLCKECDLPIHRANQHTRTHSRFLLTRGLEISAAGFESDQTATCTSNDTDLRLDLISNPNCSESISSDHRCVNESSQPVSQRGSASTSSIPEYLMETSPGWHFEDLLDGTASPSGYYM